MKIGTYIVLVILAFTLGVPSVQAQEVVDDFPAAPGSPLDRLDPPLLAPPVEDITNNAFPQAAGESRVDTFDFGPDVPPPETVELETVGEKQQGIRDEAFDAAITGLFPMQPDDIRRVLEYYDRTQEAVTTPIYELPEPSVAVVTLSLDPGQLPPTIKVAAGHVTTLNILDITSAPWSIQDVTWAGDFEIVEPEEGGHIIRITPLSEFAYGNMSMRLLGLKTPVTFSLRTARDVVHYRLDARVPKSGPNAQTPLIEGVSQLTAGGGLEGDTLSAVLDGVPPEGALRLVVSGVDGRTTAYKHNETTYVRTPLTLLSPGWKSSVSSADGMQVYGLNDTPILLLSDQGSFVRAYLKEEETSDE